MTVAAPTRKPMRNAISAQIRLRKGQGKGLWNEEIQTVAATASGLTAKREMERSSVTRSRGK